jgi:hypothetical protein
MRRVMDVFLGYDVYWKLSFAMRNYNLLRHISASSSERPGIYCNSDQAASTITPLPDGHYYVDKIAEKTYQSDFAVKKH